MRKPFISANQVTALRLILLPVGAACLYGGIEARYFALVFMTLVGCTDFIDGFLARKYGTTKLGSLMDPIADKVFVAVVFLPFADKHWLPTWVVGGIFIREFLVTAARTMHERRGIVLKSSYLGKVKTWFQMAGAALAFLLIAVHDQKKMLIIFGVGFALSMLGLGLSIALRKPNQRRGALIFGGTFAVLVAVQSLTTPAGTLDFLGYTVLGITWLSGLDYLVSGVRRIGRQLDGSDAVRAIAAVGIPTLALSIVHYTQVPIWPIIVVVAFELSLGGLDNLLAHHRVEPSGLSWALRSFGLMALMAVILIERPGAASLRNGLAYGLFAISVLATARMFRVYRSYYLDERPPRASASAPSQAADPGNHAAA